MHGSALVVILLACATGFIFADPGSGPDEFRRSMSEFAQMLETNATWRAAFEQGVAEDEAAAPSHTMDFTFNCQINTTEATPKTVHELRPQDINVIAALGDSITAGNGINASWAFWVLRMKRGESWSIGGDQSLEEGVHTIPNVMREFNENITGYSTGYGLAISKNAALNLAVTGSIAKDIPKQVEKLIKRMKDDPQIDFDNDWKLITLLIGGNDLCSYCDNEDKYSSKNYKKYLQEALDKLHTGVPRALVNLVAMADVSPIPFIRKEDYCHILHWGLCNCARKNATRPLLKPIQVQYHDVMKELATGGRYDTHDNFTVVLQPHLLDQDFPKDPNGTYDPNYIAPDCFHPNRNAHQALSFFYWNTMLTPVGQKPTYHDWSPSMNTNYKCPTEENPYIFTNGNSPPAPPGPSTESSTRGSATSPITKSSTRASSTASITETSSITSPTDSTTTESAGSSASSQHACFLSATMLKRLFLYGPLLAVLLY